MHRRIFAASVMSLAVGAFGAVAASAAGTPLTTEQVAGGLSFPVFVTHAPGDTSRVFIVEQRSNTTGRIRVLDLTTPSPSLLETPLLSITPVAIDSEQGLLGLAFHPDYANNGYIYVDYTRGSDGATVIERYTVNPPSGNVADPASALQIRVISQPQPNHNGGWIQFGPDGYLYVAMGDGGNFNDTGGGHTSGTGNAQDITTNLLGKMLRLDVDGDDFPADPSRNYAIPPTNPFVGVTGDDEIWSYGLRNPWRPDFDNLTGELYIADVGQDVIEEINVQPAGVGGSNYGWRCMEGLNCTGLTGCTCDAPALTLPIHTYEHGGTPFRCSITGGVVYRGCRIWDLRGTYFFADYCSDQVWSFRYAGGAVTQFAERTSELDPSCCTINDISSFGEDANGEMYICDRGGQVYRLVPNGPVVGDMNGDGVIDNGDIDGFVLGLVDEAAYRAAYPDFDPDILGDVNLDGVFDNGDIDAFVARLLAGDGC